MSDATLVASISTSDDPVRLTGRLLVLGAHVNAVADVATTSVDLDRTVAQLTTSVESTVEDAVERIQDVLKELLDTEKGQLPLTLNQLQDRLEGLLSQQSDPDNKQSLAGRIDALLQIAAKEQTRSLAAALDPHAPGSLIGRLRDDLARTVKDEAARVAKQVLELRELVATDAAVASARKVLFDKLPAKGLRFEDRLFESLTDHAVHYGDVVTQVGRQYGSAGTKRGDLVVSLNVEDTRGVAVNVAWEAKTGRVSQGRILDELEDVMHNRDACVGIAVFGNPAAAPIRVPFAHYGDKAVLVLDKDDPDDMSVQLAYTWARWVARRASAEHADQVDLERIEALLDEATRALDTARHVRKGHNMARKGIQDAASHLDVLLRDIRAALADIRTEIAAAE